MPLISAKALAAELNLKPKQIRRLALQGRIPGMRYGTTWRFDLAAVLAASIYVDHIKADAHRAAMNAQLRSNMSNMRKPFWPRPGPGRQKKGTS